MSNTGLFAGIFGTEDMRAVFDDLAMMQRWLDVEGALARAEAEFGLIPIWAAEEIARCANAELLDLEEIRAGIARTEHPLIPTIWALAEVCQKGAGEYVHWGATTQDIMDTGMVLQLAEAITLIDHRVNELITTLADLSQAHRSTIMPGRTHGQHALPITFGFKVAVWLAEFLRHADRLRECCPRVLVGQLGGATGTLASFGDDAVGIQERMCGFLSLGVPLIAWHSSRDGLTELTASIAMLTATCEKVCSEVILLQKTEVAELEEWQKPGNVGSSTMPQKRNPMTAESVVALSRLARQYVAVSLECMVHQHERDMSAWEAEWAYIPDVFILSDAALTQTLDVLSTLTVHPDRMSANLAISDGLIMAEPVMLKLAETIGRQKAHEIVYAVAMNAVESGRPFADCLAEEAIPSFLSDEDMRALLDPHSYLGVSTFFVDRVVGQARALIAERTTSQMDSSALEAQ